MRNAILSVAAAIMVCACSDPVDLQVTDNSFEISATAQFDTDTRTAKLVLSLDKGCPKQEYSVVYEIDGDKSGSNSQKVKFDEATCLAEIALPDLSVGEHRIDLSYSNGYFSQTGSCSLTISRKDFTMHAEVSTASSRNSTVLISLKEGQTDVSYKAEVYKDKDVIASLSDIDFNRNPIAMVNLPVMRPGSYGITVKVTDGFITREHPLVLDEPNRHPVVHCSMRYDSKSGDILFKVVDNPYNLKTSSECEMTVNGSVTVNLQTGYFHGGPNTKKHTKSLSDKVTSEILVPQAGKEIVLCNFKDLEKELSSMSEQSYVWAEGYNYDMEEEGTWCMNFTESKYYSVTSRAVTVKIFFEKLGGMSFQLDSKSDSWISQSFTAKEM